MTYVIELQHETDITGIDTLALERMAARTLEAESVRSPAELSIVLADAVKFGRRAAEFLGRASEVDRILTDASASDFEAVGLRPGQRLDITKGGMKP